jgi:hypothetical protein
MKTIKNVNLLLTITLFMNLAFSCNKNNETVNLESDEAAELIAKSISSDNGGSSVQFTDACTYSENIYNPSKMLKDDIFDTTFVIANQPHTNIQFGYTFYYQYGIRYNQTAGGFEFFLNFDTDGNYNSSRIHSEDASEGNLTLRGLEPNDEYYSVSGTVTRIGNQTTAFKEEKSISSKIVFNFEDILITKSDHKIVSGSGDIKISGKTSTGQEFIFTGSLEYLVNETIILNLEGKVYTIDLNSGEIQ